MISSPVNRQQRLLTHRWVGTVAALLALVVSLIVPQYRAQAGSAVGQQTQPATQVVNLASLKKSIAQQYPKVVQIGIDKYLQSKSKFQLIDVRPAAEFSVSRIPGAINISDTDKLLEYARSHADQQLLVYCSVGARSTEAADLLHAEGLSNVSNLAGSIFEWSNSGLVLENSAGVTRKVHPYNFWWRWRYLVPSSNNQ